MHRISACILVVVGRHKPEPCASSSWICIMGWIWIMGSFNRLLMLWVWLLGVVSVIGQKMQCCVLTG